MLSAADREEIENLVRSADEAATRRDDAAYAALYAEDGVIEGIKGNAEGRAAIRVAVRVVWAREPAGSEHLTRDVTIGEEEGEVVAHSTLVIVTQGVSTPFAQASVTQTLRRTDKGWRIARRLIKEPAEGGCSA
jgi:uncharacterized protein (TIGR02246 family)